VAAETNRSPLRTINVLLPGIFTSNVRLVTADVTLGLMRFVLSADATPGLMRMASRPAVGAGASRANPSRSAEASTNRFQRAFVFMEN
jgi:hypothetical protein